MTQSHRAPSHLRVAILAALASIVLIAPDAQAQIKQPGAHARYSVELEPHALAWWRDHSRDTWDNGSGWGLGLRASIPIVENGLGAAPFEQASDHLILRRCALAGRVGGIGSGSCASG
ncbi:MAG: hypothetical protein HY898_20875 [Deltaproteobacteria bacterium]|nr:hypothetical protein [Deltaproteobacteria bacterium]